MEKNTLSVRELSEKDIILIADYWNDAVPDYLLSLGADFEKLPTKEDFIQTLQDQLQLPYHLKKTYALIWEANGISIGHSNVNPFTYNEEGHMHMHIWQKANRKQVYGQQFIKLSLPYYSNNLKLKLLSCQPYAYNKAPNHALEKAGFTFVKRHITVPGNIAFEQTVNLWQLAI